MAGTSLVLCVESLSMLFGSWLLMSTTAVTVMMLWGIKKICMHRIHSFVMLILLDLHHVFAEV